MVTVTQMLSTSRNATHVTQRSFFLEVCLFNEMCANGEELFQLEVSCRACVEQTQLYRHPRL